VQAIVQIADSLKLDAVAEGIEDQATLQRLIELGCGYGQGFLWSPALAPDDFLHFVQARTGSATVP
jgi:sensor c-di-GMP phosphodiesterase-like protein